MATVLSTLYPPLIDTFMPAFPNNKPAEVHFTVSPYNSSYDIRYLHVTLVNQKTNKNAFALEANTETPAGTALINGIWILPFSESLNGEINDYLVLDRDANYYTLYIPPSLLKGSDQKDRVFLTNGYYKLQLRFDKYLPNESGWSISQATSTYISEKRAYFSEWSSVCLLKAIPEISIHFNNFTTELDNYQIQNNTISSTTVIPTSVPQYMPGIIPFAGNLTFAGDASSGIATSTKSEFYNRDIRTTSNDEYLMSYRIVIKDKLNEIIKDSKVQYPSKNEKTNNFYWLCDMTECPTNETYNVTLTFTTNNQYTFSKNYSFTLIPPSNIAFNPTITFNKIPLFEHGVYKDTLVTCEDGWVEITVENKDLTSPGYLFIKRATSLDNYQQWELMDCYYVEDGDNIVHSIVDKTVSSLVGYKYACQYLTAKGSWTRTVTTKEIVYPDFYDILLSRGDKQLAIRYNEQIASMTPVVNRVKIDTLGGRYPKFAQNAKLHYKQFQLTGLITAESDFNRTFLNDLDYEDEMETYNNNMNGTYLIRNDTVKEPDILYAEGEEGIIPKTNGTYTRNIEDAKTDSDLRIARAQKNTKHDLYPKDNWWWERKFREEVMEWLNDGEPKLYRSMTEGNLIVMLDSISLTPNAQLGRRIWNFSCTVYEVGDGNSLEQLDALGIYPVVNSYDANLTSEQGIISDTSRRRIGQTYSIQANDSGTTKLVMPGEFDERYQIVITNNDGEVIEKVKTLSLGEEVANLYSGLYENYKFNTSSLRLYDLKVQFESLPQWYDLDSMSPQGFLDGGLYLTIDTEVNDETTGETVTETVTALIKRSTTENEGLVVSEIITDTIPLWFKAGMSVTDFITEWENAAGNLYFQIKDDQNNNINYIISQQDYEYKYYKTAEKDIIIDDGFVRTLDDGYSYIGAADLQTNRYIKNEDDTYDQISLNSQYWSLESNNNDNSSWKNSYYKIKTGEEEVLDESSYIYLSSKLFGTDFKNMIYKKIENDENEEICYRLKDDKTYHKGVIDETENVEYFDIGAENPTYRKITYQIPVTDHLDDNTESTDSNIEIQKGYSYEKDSDLDKRLYKKLENPQIILLENKKEKLQAEIKALQERLYVLAQSNDSTEESAFNVISDEQNKITAKNKIITYLQNKEKLEHLKDIWTKWKNIADDVPSGPEGEGATWEPANPDHYERKMYDYYYNQLEVGEKDSTSAVEYFDNENVKKIYNELLQDYFNNIPDNLNKAIKEIEDSLKNDNDNDQQTTPGDSSATIKYELVEENIKNILGEVGNDDNELYTEYITLINKRNELDELNTELNNASLITYYSNEKIKQIENKEYEEGYYDLSTEDNTYKKVEEIGDNSIRNFYIYDNVFKTYLKVSTILNLKSNTYIYIEEENNYYVVLSIDENTIYYKKNNSYYNMNMSSIYYELYSRNNDSKFITDTLWNRYINQYFEYSPQQNSYEYILKDLIDIEHHYIQERLPSGVYIYKLDADKTAPDFFFKTKTESSEKYNIYTYLPLEDVFSNEPYIFIKSIGTYVKDSSTITENRTLGPGNELTIVDVDTGRDLTHEINDNNIDSIVDACIWELDKNQKQIRKNNYGLGYKLRLNLVSPYDSSVQLERTIFVNERGYYQVPSNMIVKEVSLFDGAKATLDYILEYDLRYDDATEPSSYEVSEKIVGQISGEWDPNTSITPLIKAKYWASDKQDRITTQQMIDYWTATTYDGTPYTILYIQPTNEIGSIQYIVGRSGVLNLQTDYPTLNMSIQGKRMVQAPISRQPYLDEWEYVIDPSVYSGQQDEDDGFGNYWWILYNNKDADESGIIVKVHIEDPIELENGSILEFDEDNAKEVADVWYTLDNIHYNATEILDPMPNTVYGIINTLGNIEYKIYYLDQGWFTVEFPNANQGDYSIAYARVPVYGMIDYQATIMKKVWKF